MREFFLEEVTTTAKFRSQLANEWRRCVYVYHRVRAIRLTGKCFVCRHQTDDGRVIDVMLFKGSQELVTVLAHHF